MSQPPLEPERIADDTARQLLARAAALDTDGPTLPQLRQAAAESGISHAAFDAAVAEWRADSMRIAEQPSRRRWMRQAWRNAAAFAAGWSVTAGLSVAQQLVDAPWLVHKLTNPVGMAIGALIAARLRARTATVLLGGLAVSTGAEFLMDLFSGAPAVQGFGAHMALMIAGVAGVAVGRAFWGRRTYPDAPDVSAAASAAKSPSSDTSQSESVGLTNTRADKRFTDLLRLRRGADPTRVQLRWRVGPT